MNTKRAEETIRRMREEIEILNRRYDGHDCTASTEDGCQECEDYLTATKGIPPHYGEEEVL